MQTNKNGYWDKPTDVKANSKIYSVKPFLQTKDGELNGLGHNH